MNRQEAVVGPWNPSRIAQPLSCFACGAEFGWHVQFPYKAGGWQQRTELHGDRLAPRRGKVDGMPSYGPRERPLGRVMRPRRSPAVKSIIATLIVRPPVIIFCYGCEAPQLVPRLESWPEPQG